MSSQQSAPSAYADLLRQSSVAFCHTLLAPPLPREVLAKHFTSKPKITEHGPEWANARLPFLGKTFSGVDECVSYFDLLSQTLRMYMGMTTWPGEEGFIVDEDAVDFRGQEGQEVSRGAVSVVGKARFESVKTGKDWNEQFIYRLSNFDTEGKIGHWEIWADPLSAWVAVGGDHE